MIAQALQPGKATATVLRRSSMAMPFWESGIGILRRWLLTCAPPLRACHIALTYGFGVGRSVLATLLVEIWDTVRRCAMCFAACRLRCGRCRLFGFFGTTFETERTDPRHALHLAMG